MKPFKTCVIDPPWPYAPSSKHKKQSGYVPYQTMKIEEMLTLPINEVMDKDEAYLFVWTTGPFLVSGETTQLVRAWGFKPITMLVWHKMNKFVDGAAPKGKLGVGFWFRAETEYVVVAKRENAPSVRTMERNYWPTEALRHSKKPDWLHLLIETRRPPYVIPTSLARLNKQEIPASFPGPFLEIFGRESRPGWTILGNQAPEDGKDIRISLNEQIEKIQKENPMIDNADVQKDGFSDLVTSLPAVVSAPTKPRRCENGVVHEAHTGCIGRKRAVNGTRSNAPIKNVVKTLSNAASKIEAEKERLTKEYKDAIAKLDAAAEVIRTWV